MNGFKLLAYEIKRLIWTKIYAGLLLLTLLFSYYVLSSRTIFGTAYTAPFSPWSFAAYLFDILPFLLLTTLFFLHLRVLQKRDARENHHTHHAAV